MANRTLHCRLQLLVNKVSFDEQLVTFAEWHATMKALVIKELNPAGSLPVLLMNGKSYQEHVAICRYLARKVCS